MIELPPREAHLWHLRPDPLPDETIAALDALLSADERERGARVIPAPARHRHLLTRALVRTTLSRYEPVAPGTWRFVANQWGRPAIDPAVCATDLRFNLSHCDGLIVCAVARGVDLGVDVEDRGRRINYLGVGQRVFSPAELAELRAASPAERPARFFDYWTLKEAYIKARGMGLALPLRAISFDLRGAAPTAAFEPSVQDDAREWQFERRAIGGHAIALAIRAAGQPFLVRMMPSSAPLR